MRSLRVKLAVGVAVVGAAATTAAAVAGDRGKLRTTLTGYEEVPALSTSGGGSFKASLGRTEIRYELRYAVEGGAVQQAHIHVGQEGVNGQVSAFLCSNLPNPPAGTPACPTPGGTVEGTIEAADVIGPAAQGIEPGSFEELSRAIRAGVAYVNVHSERWPAGEIRGQLDGDDDRGHGRHGDD